MYLLRLYRIELLKNGVPLYWYNDVKVDNPAFEAIQFLTLEGIIQASLSTLDFRPNNKMDVVTANIWLKKSAKKFGLLKSSYELLMENATDVTRAEFAQLLYSRVIRLMNSIK